MDKQKDCSEGNLLSLKRDNKIQGSQNKHMMQLEVGYRANINPFALPCVKIV
jgi:hypothetical protein